MQKTAEHKRLQDHLERKANWKKWGPYLSERAWGTVREDYSPSGNAWEFFPHDHARSRTFRWGEDGIAGISDRYQYICFSLALWNHHDPILKERLFGLTGSEGNHGEDVKEYYYYLDATPTHSYLKMLYKYPQAAFPYAELVVENGHRGFDDSEYELADTGVFTGNRYFDVFVEYAKAGVGDILIRISAHNRGPETAPLDLLPTVWFRNTWRFGYDAGPMGDVPGRPVLKRIDGASGDTIVHLSHPAAGDYYLYADRLDGNSHPQLLFTDNESNTQRLFGRPNANTANTNGSSYVKAAFHRHVVNSESNAVNPAGEGTKAAAWYNCRIPSQGSCTLRLRLSASALDKPFADFSLQFNRRVAEADAFYAAIQRDVGPEQKTIQRQALAGMIWTKQFFEHFLRIAQAMTGDHRGGVSLWNEEDGFFYDTLHLPDDNIIPLKVGGGMTLYPGFAAGG